MGNLHDYLKDGLEDTDYEILEEQLVIHYPDYSEGEADKAILKAMELLQDAGFTVKRVIV